MNKTQINKALKDGIEVAVYAVGLRSRIPADLFRHSDYKQVVRCRVIATEQPTVLHSRRMGVPNPILSWEALAVRVKPLDAIPDSLWDTGKATLGEKPPHPEFDPDAGRVYDEDTDERLVTSRHIITTWPAFEALLKARNTADTEARAEREAREAATKAGLDAAADMATKLDHLGLPVSVEINRPGAVVMSVAVAEKITAALSAAQDMIDAANAAIEAPHEDRHRRAQEFDQAADNFTALLAADKKAEAA